MSVIQILKRQIDVEMKQFVGLPYEFGLANTGMSWE